MEEQWHSEITGSSRPHSVQGTSVRPPFPDQPGYNWYRRIDGSSGVVWQLLPENVTWLDNDLNFYRKTWTFEPPNEGYKVPEEWRPSDGLPAGWKLPEGIDGFFPGGLAPIVGTEMKDVSKNKATSLNKRAPNGKSAVYGFTTPADLEDWGFDPELKKLPHMSANEPITLLDAACDIHGNKDVESRWTPRSSQGMVGSGPLRTGGMGPWQGMESRGDMRPWGGTMPGESGTYESYGLGHHSPHGHGGAWED